ncbi:MAG: hypothetical protein FVQ77_03595 [Cytophagales bacterium]|nr:hypothetical protein [Cytophagales bacterium]
MGSTLLNLEGLVKLRFLKYITAIKANRHTTTTTAMFEIIVAILLVLPIGILATVLLIAEIKGYYELKNEE